MSTWQLFSSLLFIAIFKPIVKNYHHVTFQINVYFLMPLVLTSGQINSNAEFLVSCGGKYFITLIIYVEFAKFQNIHYFRHIYHIFCPKALLLHQE